MKNGKKISQKKAISKKGFITKEKYDNLWNKIFFMFLALAFVGLYYLVRDIDKFRKKLISLNPSDDFPKISDFKICIPLL